MKKNQFTLLSILSLICLGSISSCAVVTVPLKVAGKAATTTVGVAGKVAGAGIGAVTPRRKMKE